MKSATITTADRLGHTETVLSDRRGVAVSITNERGETQRYQAQAVTLQIVRGGIEILRDHRGCYAWFERCRLEARAGRKCVVIELASGVVSSRGKELTVAVLGDRALAVTELQTSTGFYDYEAKYTEGKTMHICPAVMEPEVYQAMLAYALKAHRLLGCKGASRSDFRWDDGQGLAGIYLLEVNTQPGMTPLSLVPEQAKYVGISYEDLVDQLVKEALSG